MGKGTRRGDVVHNWELKSPFTIDTFNDECWLWKGALDKDGYGVFTLNKRKTPAHVASFILAKDDIKPGNYVLYKCHNPSCVNPAHLYQGTQKQNIQDQIDNGTFVYGSKNGMALLDEEKVNYARQSGKSARQLATEFEVSYHTMWDVLKGRSWKHLL